MNNFFKKLIFNILILDIFRRRFFIYQDKETKLYYVKTKKLFYFSKYIHYNNFMFYTYHYSKRKALINCSHKTKKQIAQTILQYRKYKMTIPTLKYEKLWSE